MKYEDALLKSQKVDFDNVFCVSLTIALVSIYPHFHC